MLCPEKIRVYNVGNGNFIVIYYKGTENGKTVTKKVIFDCGNDLHTNDFTENIMTDDIKENLSYIFISHMHIDHLEFLCDFECERIIKREDIKINNSSKTFEDGFFGKLNKKIRKTTQLSDKAITNFQTEFGGTEIYYTDTIDYNESKKDFNGLELIHKLIKFDNKKNDTSMIMVITGVNGKKAILAADASYYFWPDKVIDSIKDVNYVVIPHHGQGVHCFDEKDNSNPIVVGNDCEKIIACSVKEKCLSNCDYDNPKLHEEFIKRVFPNAEIDCTGDYTNPPYIELTL